MLKRPWVVRLSSLAFSKVNMQEEEKKEPAIPREALLDVLFQSNIVMKYGNNLEEGIQQSLGKHKFSPESEKYHHALILCKVYKILLLDLSIIK